MTDIKWKSIEEYDHLKKKPKYVVFLVKEQRSGVGYPLSEMVTTERRYGNRAITHFIALPDKV